MKYYTIYEKNTDFLIASGNAKECAKQMKKSLNGFYSCVSKNIKGIQNKYIVLIDKEKKI